MITDCIENSLSLADIVVWSNLYPLFGKEDAEVRRKYLTTTRWFDGLAKEKFFKESVEKAGFTK